MSYPSKVGMSPFRATRRDSWEDVLALNQRDRDRLKELHAVVRGRQTVSKAARHMGVSRRHARRLVRRLEREVARGVRIGRSRRKCACGRWLYSEMRNTGTSPRPWPPSTLPVRYRGQPRDGEGMAVRGGAVEAAQAEDRGSTLWRERRAAFGELVLMDTSDHDWLEGRAR